MTKSELRALLEQHEVEYSRDATKDELLIMLEEIEEQLEIDVADAAAAGEELTIELKERKDLTPKEVPARPGQATLAQCMHQMQGRKFDGTEFEADAEE